MPKKPKQRRVRILHSDTEEEVDDVAGADSDDVHEQTKTTILVTPKTQIISGTSLYRNSRKKPELICLSDDDNGANVSGSGDSETDCPSQHDTSRRCDSDSELEKSDSDAHNSDSEKGDSKSESRRSIQSDCDESEYDSESSFVDNDSAHDISHSTVELDRIHGYVPQDPYNAYIEESRSNKKKQATRRKSKSKRITGRGRGTRGKRARPLDLDDDDDEDTARAGEFEPDSQEVSIHLINVSHRKFKNCDESPEAVIHTIISLYNDPPKGKRKREGSDRYVIQEILEHPKLKPQDKDHFQDEDFQVKIYTQTVHKKIPLLNQYGVKSTAAIVNSLIFHYREFEIFVLTTSQAWNVVQWCSDFTFPGKVAARILSENGATSSTVKGLVGNELVSTKTHKQAKEANPFDLLTYCTSFVAQLREDASILNLECFRNSRQEKQQDKENGNEDSDEEGTEANNTTPIPSTSTAATPRRRSSATPYPKSPKSKSISIKKPCKVTIQTGSIRFRKRFNKSDFLSLLSHLSQISRGEETTNLLGENEKDSTAHERYLSVVQSSEMVNDLNLELTEKIHNAIADINKLPHLENFELNHKYSLDFHEGSNYTLEYPRKGAVKQWEEIPSMRELILALRDLDEFTDLPEDFTEEKFLKRLDKLKLGYTKRDGNLQKPDKLLNYFQGMYCTSGDSNVFWHVNSIWCVVHQSYILIAHKRFLDILTCYLKDIELKYKWPRELPENLDLEEEDNKGPNPNALTRVYIERYSAHDNFYVPAENENLEQELADMIEVKMEDGKPSLVIYFIFPSLNYDTVGKASRMMTSLMKIQKSAMALDQKGNEKGGSEIAAKKVRELYVKARNKKPSFMNAFKKGEKIDRFLKLLLEAEVVVAFGKVEEKGQVQTQRSLQEALDLPMRITVEDIHKILRKPFDAKDKTGIQNVNLLGDEFKLKCYKAAERIKVGELLHQMLRKEEFLGEDGSITGKFLCQTRADFKLEVGVNESFVFREIILPYLPQAGTFLAKLELIRLRTEVEKILGNVNVNKFRIVEIPLDEEQPQGVNAESDQGSDKDQADTDRDTSGSNNSDDDEVQVRDGKNQNNERPRIPFSRDLRVRLHRLQQSQSRLSRSSGGGGGIGSATSKKGTKRKYRKIDSDSSDSESE